MQVCQPFGVLDVRLPPGDGFEVLRIGQEDVASFFQDIPNWVPVDPGRLECQVLDVKGAQPLISGQQVGRHRRKRSDLLLNRAISLGPEHTHHDCLFMPINTCTAVVNHLHLVALTFLGLVLPIKRVSAGYGFTTSFLLVLARYARWQHSWVLDAPRSASFAGSLHHGSSTSEHSPWPLF
jgi:hypothetical protein